ncbi:lsd1/2 complex phd finger containing protein phf2 [Gigaspora margarita]|uniref:Histone H1 n=1 Tax=Gigaspora margarita TaxID=4874 RepID=A0A8H4AQ58_GIGMA|nr:lsd1/2 complex phd finger containing protein phf2 [Gigaspora margarita]
MSQPSTSVPVSNGVLDSPSTADSTIKQEVNFVKKSQQEEWGDEDGEFELEDIIHQDTSSLVNQRNDVAREIKFPEHEDANKHLSNMSNMPNNTGVDSNIDNSANTDKVTLQNKSIDMLSSVTPDKNDSEHPSLSSDFDDLPKTKYGRKVHKPVLFTPDVKKPSNENRNKNTNKRRRNLNASSRASIKGDQDTTDDIVCTICRDGRSPKHNRIVLCDRCDIPYHQRCHKPSIEERVIEIPDAEWICAKCEEVLRGRKRRKVDSSNISSGSVSVSGNGLTDEQKVAYLSSLPQRVLIDLILIAEKLHPDLPLYPADIKEKIANNAYNITFNQDPSLVDDRLTSVSSSVSLQSPDLHIPASTSISQGFVVDTTESTRAHLPAVGVDLPSYEEMIVQALTAITDPSGSAPRSIFEWMNNKYPLHKNFRASASQALQKAVKKERILRIGTVYKLNSNYKPVKRVRRFFKRPQDSESQPFKGISSDNDNIPDHKSQNGIYEIAVRMSNMDSFSSVQIDVDDHPSLSSSAVSTPVPNVVSNGNTAVTSPENDLPTDDIPNQSVLPPVIGRNTTPSLTNTTINSTTDLPSTLLPPPGQPTLPSLSSVAPYFGSNFGGNNGSGSMFSPYRL